MAGLDATACDNRVAGLSRKESHDGNDHDHRSGHREVSVPGARIDAAGEVIVRRQLSRAGVLGDVEDDAG